MNLKVRYLRHRDRVVGIVAANMIETSIVAIFRAEKEMVEAKSYAMPLFMSQDKGAYPSLLFQAMNRKRLDELAVTAFLRDRGFVLAPSLTAETEDEQSLRLAVSELFFTATGVPAGAGCGSVSLPKLEPTWMRTSGVRATRVSPLALTYGTSNGARTDVPTRIGSSRSVCVSPAELPATAAVSWR